MNRPESLKDQIATIIQAGFIANKTSDEIAGEVALLTYRIMADNLAPAAQHGPTNFE